MVNQVLYETVYNYLYLNLIVALINLGINYNRFWLFYFSFSTKFHIWIDKTRLHYCHVLRSLNIWILINIRKMIFIDMFSQNRNSHFENLTQIPVDNFVEENTFLIKLMKLSDKFCVNCAIFSRPNNID